MTVTWLITGSSRGFGWELARAALHRGDNVVATARRPKQLDPLVQATARAYGPSHSMSPTPVRRGGPNGSRHVRIPRRRGEQRRLRQQCSN